MANTFGILAALVLAFSAFVAYKNKEEYQTQIDITKNEESKLETQKRSFDLLVEEVGGLNEEIDSTNVSRDDFQSKLKVQNDENKTIEQTISTKEDELKETKARVAEAKDLLDRLGDLPTLAKKIEAIKNSVAQLEDDLAIIKAQNSRLYSEKNSTSETVSQRSSVLNDRVSGNSLPSLRTSVSGVDRSVGLITLAAGDNSGVVSGSKLDVKRNGETIAQLVVTGVSANASAASVVMETLKEGESVLPGDTVVPAGNTSN